VFDPAKEYETYKARQPKHHCGSHERTPACVLQCVNWVLDIEECTISDQISRHREPQNNLMDPNTTKNIAIIVSNQNFEFINF
jgi:hypothetical protein